jgi:polyisoprenoid-binding protein YceI
MKPTLLLAAVLCAGVAPAAAQAPAQRPVQAALGPQVAPDDILPGVYVIDSKETLVRYTTNHMGFNDFWGTFAGATGTLTIDPKNIAAARLEVKVPIAFVETTNRELDHELFSDEFFDGENHHVMQFTSTAVSRTGERTAKVTGNLSLHGITRPVTLDVTFTGAGPNAFSKVPTLGFKAEGMVKRSDFGMGKFVPIVSDETQITISAAFEKKPG